MVESRDETPLFDSPDQRFISISKKLIKRNFSGKEARVRRTAANGTVFEVAYNPHSGDLRELHANITHWESDKRYIWHATVMRGNGQGVFFGIMSFAEEKAGKITQVNYDVPEEARETACNSILDFMDFVTNSGRVALARNER